MRTEYKNNHRSKNYDRIEIIGPRGTKEKISVLAENKHLSVSAYILDLITKDQLDFFDTFDISYKNRQFIENIKGDPQTGYIVKFMDGHIVKCLTKRNARNYIIKYCRNKKSLPEDTLSTKKVSSGRQDKK